MQDPLAHFIGSLPQLPLPEQEKLICPRCDSTNTKFCYYNNYNLSQPRHFCKSCRRYWTKGGSLRNIPVGGASRKNTKRSSSGASATCTAAGRRSPPPSSADQKGDVESGVGTSGLSLPAGMDGFASMLLASNGNGGQYNGGGGGETMTGMVGEPTTGCWSGGGGSASNNGWTDLAIFTPASRFL